MLCYMFSGLIGTRSQILQKHGMNPTVDSAFCSIIVTLFAPCFMFGDHSVNGGSFGISWLIILYGLIQGGLLWVIYRQICKTALVEKKMRNRALISPLVLLVLCVVLDHTLLSRHEKFMRKYIW